MTWVRLDDLWIQSPEMVAAGDKAVLLALWCLSWSALNLTDGRITDEVIRGCMYVRHPDTRKRSILKLEEIGFWTRVEGGFQVAEPERFLRKAAVVLEERAANAERQRRWAERQKAKRNAGTNGVRKDAPNAPPVPDPNPVGVKGRGDPSPPGDAPNAALDSAGSSVSPPLGAEIKCDRCGKTLVPTDGVPTEDAVDWTWRDKDMTVRWCDDCWAKDPARNGSVGYGSGICMQCNQWAEERFALFDNPDDVTLWLRTDRRSSDELPAMIACAECVPPLLDAVGICSDCGKLISQSDSGRQRTEDGRLCGECAEQTEEQRAPAMKDPQANGAADPDDIDWSGEA